MHKGLSILEQEHCVLKQVSRRTYDVMTKNGKMHRRDKNHLLEINETLKFQPELDTNIHSALAWTRPYRDGPGARVQRVHLQDTCKG